MTSTDLRPPPPPPTLAPLPPHAVPGGAVRARRRCPRALRVAVRVAVLLALAVAVGLLVRADAVTRLPAPGGLGATRVAYDGFDVAWAPAAHADGYLVRVARDPQLADVVWSGRVDGPGAHVGAGPDGAGSIREGSDLFVSVAPVRAGVVGATTPVLFVHTPLQAPATPGRPTLRGDTAGITVTWPRAARASGYVVTVARDARLKDVVEASAVVHGTRYRLAVRDGATYHVTVRPYRGTIPGSATAVHAVTTPLKKVGRPGRPVVRALSATSATVSWEPAANATRYTVHVGRVDGAPGRTVATTTRSSVTLRGLHPGKLGVKDIFSVRVTADRYGRGARTSPARVTSLLAGTPRGKVAFTTTVATYNLLKTQKKDAEGRSWKQRFTASGKQLRGVGIAGLQEVAWVTTGGKRPALVVAKAAGLTVARHPKSARPCTATSQPVLYAKKTFTVTRCGAAQVSRSGPKRFATWVELKHRGSGQKVLVVNAHLVAYDGDRSTTDPKVQRERAGQAKRVVALIRKHVRHGEPVIVTGDLNTFPGRFSTTPLDVLAAAGWTSADLTAGTATDVASYHGFSAPMAAGHSFDHVLVDRHAVATSYRVHVVDPARAPSDHYEVSARVQVHRTR